MNKRNLLIIEALLKFAAKPYEAILQPYCLKAFDNRWYLFARKENTEHAGDCLQCFALDRICSLKLLPDTFCPDPTIDPLEYFRDAYGIWVDTTSYPVEDVTIACTPKVAHYLRSLPLHHTQLELPSCESSQGPLT